MPGFTVIVPALNEEANLDAAVGNILCAFERAGLDVELLVFDDASSDRTGEIADQWERKDPRVRAFHHSHSLNIGGVYKAGIRRASGEYTLLIPGDNEVRMEEVVRGAGYAGTSDIIIFHVTNAWQTRPAFRVILSGLYVRLVNLLFNTRFRYTNGTNIVRTSLLRRVPILTDGFSYQTEVLVKALRSGADFIEVGIRLQPRGGGRSKALSWRNLRLVVASLSRLWLEVVVRERDRYGRFGRRLGTF